MNLLEIYETVLDNLGEDEQPQFWSERELKRFINKAVNQFIADTEYLKNLFPLIQAEAGAYYVPQNLIKCKKVYYKGKPLDYKSVDYLDSKYGGIAHQDEKIGVGFPFEGSWRIQTGEPIHWYFEDAKIKLFPIPEAEAIAAGGIVVRRKQEGMLSWGENIITLATEIPMDQDKVDLFLGGIYQHKPKFEILTPTTIKLTELVDVPGGVSFEVVSLGEAVTWEMLANARKYSMLLKAGTRKINIPTGYIRGIGAVSISIDGITQAQSAFVETDTFYIDLVDSLETDSLVELSITIPDAAVVTAMRYVYSATKLSDNYDEPPFPEFYHDCIPSYACYLALKKEGETQDLQKAAINKKDYEDIKSQIETLTVSEIDINPADEMPFFV